MPFAPCALPLQASAESLKQGNPPRSVGCTGTAGPAERLLCTGGRIRRAASDVPVQPVLRNGFSAREEESAAQRRMYRYSRSCGTASLHGRKNPPRSVGCTGTAGPAERLLCTGGRIRRAASDVQGPSAREKGITQCPEPRGQGPAPSTQAFPLYAAQGRKPESILKKNLQGIEYQGDEWWALQDSNL